MKKPRRDALATDKVRYVGDPVAFVVAETVWQAKDAAEAVDVDIDAASRRHRAGSRRTRRRAAALRRCAGKYRARLSLRRRRGGRSRVCARPRMSRG